MKEYSRRDFLKTLGLGFILLSHPERQGNLHFNWFSDAPPSLMLHSANWRQIPELIPQIQGNFAPMTYERWLTIISYKESLSRSIEGQNIIPQKQILLDSIAYSLTPPLIISIDDIATSWIRREHLGIINDFREAHIPAVIALQPDRLTQEGGRYWELIREVHAEGWEIASHTINHSYLPNVSTQWLRSELIDSYQRIRDAVGTGPSTLILPFGALWREEESGLVEDERIFEVAQEAGYKLIVGVHRWPQREPRNGLPEFLGRVAPGENALATLDRLQSYNS